jgi:hypothetical protein
MRASAGSKGSDFFSRKRTTASASSGLGGAFRNRAARRAPRCRAESQSRRATAHRRCRARFQSPCRMAAPSRRFASIKSGTTAPGASSRAAEVSTIRPIGRAPGQHAIRCDFAGQRRTANVFGRAGHWILSWTSESANRNYLGFGAWLRNGQVVFFKIQVKLIASWIESDFGLSACGHHSRQIGT